MSSPMLFFNTIEKLKTTTRKGWVNEGIENPESIADHMFRMATMTMLCTDQSLDRDRMVKLALVHDMAEALVGDITPLDKIPKEEKQRLELDAIHQMCQLLPGDYKMAREELLELFLEYENKSTAEARFVKDIDKFEFVLQTFEYERQLKVGRLDHFVASSAIIVHPLVKSWCQEVLDARELWWKEHESQH